MNSVKYAFSGSYPERLKNAAQGELPVGCDLSRDRALLLFRTSLPFQNAIPNQRSS